MRTFILLFIFSTSFAFAQSFSDDIQKAEADLRTKLMHARTRSEFTGTYPNDKYVEEYGKVMDEHLQTVINVHKKYCDQTPSTNCLNPADIQLKEAQNRISKGLVTRKNDWAKEGVSPEVQTQRETEYAREESINLCANHNTGCDNLPEGDRAIASERASNTTSNTPEQDKEAMETKLTDEFEVLLEEFYAKFPDIENDVTAEGLAAFKELERIKLEKIFAAYAELCAKHPDKEDMCLDDEEKGLVRDVSEGQNCFAERRYHHSIATDKSKVTKVESSTHDEEWAELPVPKSCQTLIDKDKTVSTEGTQDTTTTVSAVNDDENNPRNYVPETCKWVTDLPKKIVNGPGCSTTSRSRICTGYVICDQKEGGAKFIRMSTCRPEYCSGSDEDAVRCTKDMRYFSEKPFDEDNLFMSSRLKEILSGASEQ